MKLSALYYVHQSDQATVMATAESVLGPVSAKNMRFFSAWGILLQPCVQFKPCAHYLTPLDHNFKEAVVLLGAIPLPVSDKLAALLGQMLSSMGPGSTLWIQRPTNARQAVSTVKIFLRTGKKNSDQRLPEANYLQSCLPSLRVSEVSRGGNSWLRLEHSAGLDSDVRRLGSSYPMLAYKLPEFKEQLARAGHPCKSPLTEHPDSAENAFSYSMHWALHTAAVLEKCAALRNRTEKPLKIVDLGGSYGFLGCELASGTNCEVKVVELIAWRVESILPWLSSKCGLGNRLQGLPGRMQDFEAAEASIDLVLMMGSLLCLPRADVRPFLRKAMKFVQPGGCMVIRENLLLEDNRGPVGAPEMRFTPQELHAALSDTSGRIEYFDHSGKKTSHEEFLQLWTTFAVVWKD
jgi:hypothetical protein